MIRVDPHNIGPYHKNIPTYDNGVWILTNFNSRKEFAEILESDYFFEPGEYDLDESCNIFNSEAIRFNRDGYYCDFLDGSLDHEDYWDWETLKCCKGIFVWNNGKKWYLPKEYYFWINFLPIIEKVSRKEDFPDIWDTQLWMALYEWIGELNYRHGIVLKKRQFGSSFYHMAKLVRSLWFDKSPVLKMGASLDDYTIGVDGTWKFANMYRSFLNKETAWVRAMNPGGVGQWHQKVEVNEGGRTYDVGNMGTLRAMSFHQSDTTGVGGLTTYFFYEEAGIAKSMDKTFEFLRPAMQSGDITTGYFVGAGTVGDLSQCRPLKNYMYKAKKNNFQTIRNKHVNYKGTIQETGLFVPEQYSMPPFIDKFGNSMVAEATKRLEELYKEWERDLESDVCQIRKSQQPINMEVAFSAREESRIPLGLVNSHKLDVDDGNYPVELIELDYDKRNKIIATRTTKPSITQFPVDKKMIDKTGSICVYERPDENPEWHTYYASVDPVSEGKTTASDSLCSICVYKNPIEVTKYENGKSTTHIEGDKLVCTWAGRFDDLNETHRRLELIIEWYNAWTLVEANVYLFVVYMISQKKQKYLVPKSEMVFLKEHGFNKGTFQEYGWKNTGNLFVNNLLTYLIMFLKEKIHIETDENGNEISTTYGIVRIPDTMILEEMRQYAFGLNVDRLISLAALIAFVKLQGANKGYKKRFETEDREYLQKSEEIYKLDKRSPFRNIGSNRGKKSNRRNRSAFKNIK